MWVSPDEKIHKLVVEEGVWGKKPSEDCECQVIVTDNSELLEYNNSELVIGDSDNYMRRILDICLCTMNEGELAKFTIAPENVKFTIRLIGIKFNGYIYSWDARKKFELAQKHKDRGVELFRMSRAKDAVYRFVKGLKIIASIPINAEKPPDEIDSVPLKDIVKLKANLYNNIASYHLKNEKWLLTMDTCRRVFQYDEDNVKAHYKIAVAYMKELNWEEAERELNIVLGVEPNNKAALKHMKVVKDELHKANARINLMIKKMFV